MPESASPVDASPLRYAEPPELGPACRPLPRVDVLNTRDERVGEFSGLLLSATSDTPLYLVLQRGDGAGERRLIPIGSAWLDQTAKAIRVDNADVQSATIFDLGEFERMTPAEVAVSSDAFSRSAVHSFCEGVTAPTTTLLRNSNVPTG